MNKLFTKIVGAALGLTMAIGVGVAVGSGRNVTPVEATSGTYTIGWGSSGTDQTFAATSGTVTFATGHTASFSTAKNSSANDPAYNSSNKQLRLYYASNGSGGSVTFTCSEVTITGFTITSSTSPTLKYSVNGGATTSLSASNNTYTASGLSASTSIMFQNGNTTNTQLQIKTIAFTYTYTDSTYSVTYDDNDADSGSAPTDATAYNDGASVTVAGNTGSLVKANHEFSGWTLNAQGTGTVYGPGDGQTHTYTIASADVTFYAKWVDTRQYIDIETSSEHLSVSGTTHVLEDSTNLSVTLVVDATWKLPSTITITGAKDSTWSYNASTGVISGLNVAKANVTIAGTATKASISAIEVAVDDSEKSFYLGHEFTHSTAVVTGYYDDPYLTPENVTAGCTWSEPDMFTTGEKEITVTHTASGEDDSYIINVSNKVVSVAKFTKVTSTANVTSGKYLIVYETGSVAFNGGINSTSYDVESNTVSVSISDGVIAYSDAMEAATFTYDASTGYFLSKAGYYIGRTANSNGLNASTTSGSNYANTVSISSGNATLQVTTTGSNKAYLRYNTASGQTRFRYYTSSSSCEAVQLYKYSPAVTKDLIKITATEKSATRYVGDTVTASDFNVTAYYDDGTNGSVTATSLINATLNSTSNTVTVNYTENAITKSVNVVVAAEERSAELNGLSWEQAGLTVFKGDELDFSTLGTITASYDGDSEATKGIASCTVGLYSKAAEVYTREKTITDGHEFALSENGLYLGVEYTEDAITVKAYSSAVVNVVDTINAVYEQEPVYTFSRVTSINSGDVVTFVNEAASKVATSHSSNVINATAYDGDVTTTFTFTVGKVGDYYTFHNANGYLGNHSTGTSGNNYAYLDAEIDEENNQNYFTVAFDGNNVVITSVYDDDRTLQFNSTRFCFYGNSQSVVQLYKGSAGYSPTGSNIANTNAVAQKAALDYVTYFNTTMACVNDGSTANVSTKWTAVSDEFTRVLGTLNGDALANFKALFAYAYARGSDEYNDTDPLQDMLAKYNHIVKAHGVEDFLNENPINRPTAQYANTNIFGLFGKDSGSTATIIIIISMISLTTIAGYAIIRKRKEQ